MGLEASKQAQDTENVIYGFALASEGGLALSLKESDALGKLGYFVTKDGKRATPRQIKIGSGYALCEAQAPKGTNMRSIIAGFIKHANSVDKVYRTTYLLREGAIPSMDEAKTFFGEGAQAP